RNRRSFVLFLGSIRLLRTRVPMKMTVASGVVVLLLGFGQVVLAEPPRIERGKELVALEQKILGTWRGGGCDGCLVLRADRAYELTDYGPAGQDFAGTWQVRWDALPPTLVLTCKTSRVPGQAGKTTEVKIIKLDDRNLAIEYGNQNGSP